MEPDELLLDEHFDDDDEIEWLLQSLEWAEEDDDD